MVHGTPLNAATAYFSGLGDAHNSGSLVIAVSDDVAICTQLQTAPARFVGRRALLLLPSKVDVAANKAVAVDAGTYAISAGANAARTLHAEIVSADSQCMLGGELFTGGTLQLDVINSSEVAGTFDVSLQNGERIIGHFDSTGCQPRRIS